MITHFYKVLHNGQTRFISMTKEDANQFVEQDCELLLGDQKAIIRAVEEDILETKGKVIEPDSEYPHVEWQCPICGYRQYADLLKEEISPALWFCEHGNRSEHGEKKYFLVHFERST